jgi:hypothetical protein
MILLGGSPEFQFLQARIILFCLTAKVIVVTCLALRRTQMLSLETFIKCYVKQHNCEF